MTTFQSVHSVSKTQKLIDGLKRIIATNLDLPLVPIGNNKQPIGDRWQQRPFTAAQLIEAIASGGVSVPIKNQTQKIQPFGFGLITGRKITIRGFTHYLMALDQDGASACRRIDVLSGGQPLPQTVAFTSGRPGRCQYLFLIPEQYKDAIKTKKIKTGVIGDDGKAEQLEFRWKNLQSVLPPSVHPITGEYRWVDGCAIDETEIALAPDWIIEQMLIDPVGQKTEKQGKGKTTNFTPSSLHTKWTDFDFALSYLNAISSYRADDYDEWLNVGMALHSVDEELLSEWDKWSSQSAKYKPGECERKWRSFSRGGGVTLGTLAHMAKLDGWQSPFTQKTWANKYSSKRSNNNSQKNAAKKSTVTSDTATSGDTSKLELLSLEATVTTVTDVLQAGLTDYAERDRLDSIQARSVISKAAFWQM
ncbi:MAG: bifunctional DNA primase/polymerase [Pleurocapsa sp. MO_226.B13]|nr:bifunctional DNA primase/polymerase [Pleurocapsa sp. MO_226.B13]